MTDWLPAFHDFRLATPAWLWALLILPVWAFLGGRRGPRAAVRFSSARLLAAASRATRARPGWILPALRYLALAAIILGLARPQRDRGYSEREAEGINIMFVLDFSSSMNAEDFTIDGRPASRIDVLKRVVTGFIKERPDDRIGAVFFDRGAHLISPLTLDHDWLIARLMQEETTRGTAPGSGVLVAAEAMLPAKGQTRVIITVTDAEQINDGPHPVEVAHSIKDMGIKNHVIQMTEAWRVRGGSPAGDILREAARLNGGQFFQVSDTSGLKAVYAQIDRLEKSSFTEKKQELWEELMPWCVGTALALLAVASLFNRFVWRRLP